jgi:hypothetical protein
MLNSNQILSVVRDFLQICGTFLTTYGVLTSEQWEPVAGGILMIAPIVWGIAVHSKANTIKAAATLPEVAKVEVHPTHEGMELRKAAGSTPDARVTVANGRHM